MSEALRVLVETGRRIDPVMEKYIAKNASKDFLDVLLYQIRIGGKRVRPALTIVSAAAAGGKEEASFPAAAAVELVHNYSLVLDDIIDHSLLRRGHPTVWRKYGISTAILVAVHYREAASDALNDTPDPESFHEVMARTIKYLVDGERLDILYEQAGRLDEPYVVENRFRAVSLDDYLRMIERKTAVLIETACRFGGMSVGADKHVVEALSRYGYNLGMAFQVGDDIIDLFGVEEKTGKKVGQDIKEHKLGNVVVLLALEELEGEKRERLLSILRKDDIGWDEVAEALGYIRATRARERAERLRDKYVEEALNALAVLEESSYKQLLEGLAYFIKTREF